MAWVVDTVVLLDICSADPAFAQASAACLVAHAQDGLTISPLTYVELAPAFNGDAVLQEKFLAEVGIDWPSSWTLQDTQMAHALWAARIAQKRSGHMAKRPLADVLIEAFAKRFQGLITRNPKHFASVPVVVP
jgi:predicted nucleic acid-binding protein